MVGSSIAQPVALPRPRPHGAIDKIGSALVSVMDKRVPTRSRFLTDQEKVNLLLKLRDGTLTDDERVKYGDFLFPKKTDQDLDQNPQGGSRNACTCGAMTTRRTRF